MRSQEMPLVCPECDYLLDQSKGEEVEYPIELYRGKLKPGIALKFECPRCFTISYVHKD